MTQGLFGVVRVTSKEVSICMISDSSSSTPHADDAIWSGQFLIVARCNDEEQWSCQRATVEQCWPEFVVLRFQAGYRECFDWHALRMQTGVKILDSFTLRDVDSRYITLGERGIARIGDK